MSPTQSRSYHNTSSFYSLPNDTTEHQRLEYQSAAIDHMMHDQTFHAPVQNPRKVLEVGSGTGAVTRQLASIYPLAKITSNDLSPVPNQETFPANVTFLQGDFRTLATDTALLAPESFHYIFSRMLVAGMSDWPSYISQAKSLLVPGGHLELQELDIAFWDLDQNPIARSPWLSEMATVLASRGVDLGVAPKLGEYLRDAGFVDVEVKEFRWMLGRWVGHPETEMIAECSIKYAGQLFLEVYRKVLGQWKTKEEMDIVEKDIERDFAEQEGKHTRFWVVSGRKQ